VLLPSARARWRCSLCRPPGHCAGRRRPRHMPESDTPARITVVIPTLNEVSVIEETVRLLRREVDVVSVVDGGSRDETAASARNAGARVRVAVGSTRAVALNTGAAIATGEIVYFVHADCRPPPGFAADIRRAVAGGAGAGCFRLRFDSRHWLLRLPGSSVRRRL